MVSRPDPVDEPPIRGRRRRVRAREDAGGTAVVRNLQAIGFGGAIYPINPRYPEIRGLDLLPVARSDSRSRLTPSSSPCRPRSGRVPARRRPAWELAPPTSTRAVMAMATVAGKALQAEVQEIAEQYGIAVCGPNNTGIVNLHDRVAMSTGLPMEQAAGPVAIITQSRSLRSSSAKIRAASVSGMSSRRATRRS